MYNKNPKEEYFIKNWKKLNKRERKALSANVSFFNISISSTHKLSVDFLKEFENKMHWEAYSLAGVITEDILINFKHKLNIPAILCRNIYSQKFLIDNMVLLREYIPIIVQTQKLTLNAKLRLQAFYELIS